MLVTGDAIYQRPTLANYRSCYQPTWGSAHSRRDTLSSHPGQPAGPVTTTATGLLSGAPTSVDVGSWSGIVISVSDGKSTASLTAFTITVQAANRPPVIGGTPPATVMAGVGYSFTPTASDPDGRR